MSLLRCVLPLLVGVLVSGSLAAEDLPARALARVGKHQFYHGPGLECAVLSPDGSRVASSAKDASSFRKVSVEERQSYERTIVLWDAATGERVRELRVPHEPIRHLAFSPDGKRLAAACALASDQSGAVVFDVETGRSLLQLGTGQGLVTRVQFSADGKQLYVSQWDGPLSSWDAATGKQLRLWKPPSTVQPGSDKAGELAREGSLSPDGKVLVWQVSHVRPAPPGRADLPIWTNSLHVHRAETNELLFRKDFQEHVRSVAFSPDGRCLAVNCYDKLTLCATATGKELATLDPGAPLRAALAPDGRQAVILTSESPAQLWDVRTEKRSMGLYPGIATALPHVLDPSQVFSADGNTLLLATNSTLCLFDTTTGEARVPVGHHRPVSPRFSADGRTLFTACSENRCSWDLSRGDRPVLLTHESSNPWEGEVLARSSDGRLFLDDPNGYVRVREVATGRLLLQLPGDRTTHFAAFSPDATRVLLFHYSDNNLPTVFRLYDVKTGKIVGEIMPTDRKKYPSGNPVFSPDGRFIAWADATHDVHVNDALTGKVVRTLRSSQLTVVNESTGATLLFSPDGEHLAVTTYYHPFVEPGTTPYRETQPTRVFHVATGKEVQRFFANPRTTTKAAHYSCEAWSPDGRLLAVAEEQSGDIRLLEIASGAVRAVLTGHRQGVHGLAFSPDGKMLASGGEDNVCILWDVTGARTGEPAQNLTETRLAAWWADLAARDGARDGKRAGNAIAALLRAPDRGVAFLAPRLRPVEGMDDKLLTRLIADLDADDFARREAAVGELAKLGPRVEQALRHAREGATAEAKRSIDELLDRFELAVLPPGTLRVLRAVEVLEHVGTPEATRCLEALAKGTPEARETREARAALGRLAKRR
jgi:WD40 repeat protein